MYPLKNVRLFLVALALLLFVSCESNKKEVKKPKPYTGPVSIIDDFKVVFTDSARVLYKIASKHMEELQNGDRVFPKGIYVETLDGKEVVKSVLQSDSAYFDKKNQLWILKENVKLHNRLSGEQMFSEELYWDMKATDSTNVYVKEKTYVKIKTADQVFTGYGLRTSQDFKQYEILNLKGIFDVDEDEEG